MPNPIIPFWKKYALSIEEAAQYFSIGENKMRRLVSENSFESWVLRNGKRTLIKKAQFEKYLDSVNDI